MTDQIAISHSDIKAFLQCRRKWNWDFLENYRKPEPLVGPMPLGSRVHEALEHYYRGLGSAQEKHEELFKRDLAVIESDSATPPWVEEQLYKDAIVGRNCVEAHQTWLEDTGADSNYYIEAVEQTVTAPMLDGKVLLIGKVDTLFRRIDNGFLVVNDLKTDGGRPGTREQLERSWQHWAYLIALRLSKPDEVISEANYTTIRKLARPSRSGKPVVERFRVPGTSKMAVNKMAQLEAILTVMLSGKKAIEERGQDWAFPTPNHECQWCPMKQPCEIADESYEAASEMLNVNFIKGGRHARYDT